MPKKAPKALKSVFKNIWAEEPKPEQCYLDIKKPYTSGEGNYIACSGKYWAYASGGGGGAVCYDTYENTGRNAGRGNIQMHNQKVADLDFNPFNDNQLATVSDDGNVGITTLADLEEKDSEADITLLKGHEKKVHLVCWHPTVNGVVASTAWDKTVKVWDIGAQNCAKTHNTSDNAFSLTWNSDGSMLGWTDKKANLVLLDPRTEKPCTVVEEFCDGKKSSKLFFAENVNFIGATCFNKQAKRFLKIFDKRKMDDDPLFDEQVDQQSSILMPHYDEDSHQIFLAGKGDGNIHTFELRDDGRWAWAQQNFKTTKPQRGVAMIPKRAVDISVNEICRFMKLTQKDIQPISFRILRKQGGFQSELYPEARLGLPSATCEEFLGNSGTLEPVRGSLKEKRVHEAVVVEKKKTYAELEAENQELQKRIKELEEQLSKD